MVRIEILNHFVGPSAFAPVPAIRARFAVDATDAAPEDAPFADGLGPLLELLPRLRHRLGAPPAGSLAEQLAGLTAAVCLELQALAGYGVEFRAVRPTGEDDAAELVCEYKDRAVGVAALRTGLRLAIAHLPDALRRHVGVPETAAGAQVVRDFLAEAEEVGLGWTAAAVVAAAEARGIPWFRLDPRIPAVQLGHGRHRRRLLRGTIDDDGALAAALVDDRASMLFQLERAGLPVAPQAVADSREAAARIAGKMGYPVRLTVLGGDTRPRSGPGAAVDDAAALDAALDRLGPRGLPALVEKPAAGDEHRLLVVGGRVVAAVRAAAGGPVDVTDALHADARRAAVLAAEAIGLSVAHVTVSSRDIARNPLAGAGVIRRVDPAPDLRLHARNAGRVRDAAAAILDLLHPPGTDGRIPVVGVTGTNGKTTTARMVDAIHRAAGRTVGCVTTLGVSVGDGWIKPGDWAGPGGAQMVLRNPLADIAVLEVARGALIRSGLGVPACDAAAVTNVTTDHLGELGVETVDDMAAAKSVLVSATTGTVVLNADDPRCLAMAERSSAERLCLVSESVETDAVRRHLDAGGPAAVIEPAGGAPALVVYDGGTREVLLPVADVPATVGGAAVHNALNALAASALALATGASLDDVRNGLRGFETTPRSHPDRTNIFDNGRYRVVLDHAHNPAGFDAIARMIRAMPDPGRRLCVFTAPGARDDDFLSQIAGAVAPHFDEFVCRATTGTDGPPEEVPAKLRDALVANGVGPDRVSIVLDVDAAIAEGVRRAADGDVLFVMSARIPDPRYWRAIVKYAS